MTPEECRSRRRALAASTAELASRAGLVERTVIRFEARLARARPVTLVALRRGLRVLESERAVRTGVQRA
jgi:predicted transcriptional regulator